MTQETKRLLKYLAITFAITCLCWWGVAALAAFTPLAYGDALPTLFT